MNILDITNRKLPTFREWLDEHSPETRADDFAAFADLAARSQGQSLDHLKPHEASFGRMWMGACIAAVELSNIEALKHGRPSEEIIGQLPRVFAAACMYAAASALKENTPWRDIATVMSEEFRAAAKASAVQLEGQRRQ